MAYELEAGFGSLFLSKTHEEGTNRPSRYGTILLNQEMIDKIVANGFVLPLSGWDKNGKKKDGEPWELISLGVDIFKLDKRSTAPQPDPFDKAHQAVDDHQNGQSDIPDNDVPF